MWTTALGWLSELAGMIGSLVPRYFHHEWMNVGVSITRGKKVKVLRYGIIWYWPFWTEVYSRAANLQTKRIPSQTLTSRDGIRIACGGVVRYKINREDHSSVLLAMVETDDVDRAIVDEALAVFCEYVTSNDFSDMLVDRRKINTEITLRVRSELKRYGVYAERAQITNLSKCTTIALVKPDAGFNEGLEEEE